MKSRFLAGLWGLLVGCCVASAATVTGDWKGEMDVMGNKLTLVFHFNEQLEGWTMDSPDQNAKGIPVQALVNENDSVALDIPMIRAGFRGALKDSKLKGKFSQSGMSFDLELTPGTVTHNRPQTPQPPFPYATDELQIVIPGDSAVLTGTLTMPRDVKRPPLVVLVSGSGQQNRDEELFDHKPFAVIADRLARNGIASFRYDDRGVGQSTGLRQDLTTEDFKNDALEVIRFLREKKIASKIGVLGHSEGGLIAFMIAGDNPKDVDFIVSLAGTAVKGENILRRQISEALARAGMPASDGLVDAQIAAAAAQQPWMDWFVDYDPTAVISKIKCPVFAANGSKDVQVNAQENIGALKETLKVKKGDFIHIYEGLNHLFQTATTGLPDEYSKIEETISNTLLTDLLPWLTKQ